MLTNNVSNDNVVAHYFVTTDLLLNRIKQHEKGIVFCAEGGGQLHDIIAHLSIPSMSGDRIRLGFIALSEKIELELNRLHDLKLYPDLYCGTKSKFELLEYITQIHKDVLLTNGNIIPEVRLKGTSYVWRDKGLLVFALDQKNHLQSLRFDNLWDAVQCFEMQRYLMGQLFEYLNITHNL